MKTLWLFAGVAGLWGSVAWGQVAPTPYAWEEFGKRIKSSEKVEPLGPNFAGEQVSLSNGGLSFSATDVSLPGNSALKVEFRRTYNVFSRKDYGDLGMLADWEVDVPRISGVFAPDWVVGPNNSTNRCTSEDLPKVPDYTFQVEDFWQGIQVNIPGVSSGELLRTDASVAKPTDGATYYWMTNDRVHFSCLASIQDGAGQGFLAITPDGTRYWFNAMGRTVEPRTTIIEHHNTGMRVPHILQRMKNYLYATRVEDRFGNYVNYTYTNSWNGIPKLTKIEANDGRAISITYTGTTISSVSDGTRTWNYAYEATASGRKTLKSVTLPDNSKWTIALGVFTNSEIKYDEFPPVGEIMRGCTWNQQPLNWTDSFVGSITHPAGATAEFTLGIQEHGRSWVPIDCRGLTTTFPNDPDKRGRDNDTNDDINLWATSSYSFTLKQKRVYGPGQSDAVWNYTYEPNTSFYFYDGTTFFWPKCPAGTNCEMPPCTNESCAMYSVTTVSGPGGSWQRYKHGNTYRYNEGKLLQVESGSGPSDIVRTENWTYDLTAADWVYPARFGRSQRLFGEGAASELHRPETALETIQQGMKFKRQVDEFDSAARPIQVTRASSVYTGADPPPPVPGTPTLSAPATSVAGQVHVVSWTQMSNAYFYVLERNFNDTRYVQVYSGPSTSQNQSSPLAGTMRYRVRACNVKGHCSAYSSVKTVTISAPIVPGAPTLSAPTNGYRNSPFIVTWTSVANAEKYVLERRVGTSGSFVPIYAGTVTQSSPSYGQAATLYFRVKACDAANNCGAYSNIDSTQVLDQDEP